MAGKAPVNQQAAGPEADLVKDLVNDLVANLNKGDLSARSTNGALSVNGGNAGSPDSDQDEQDKDSINNEDDVTDNDEMLHSDGGLLQAGELIKHHNGRNSISSGSSSTEEEDVDELQPSVEHERIQEYLNRKDTAVVYPVDVCEATNQTLPDLPLNKLANSSPLNASDQQPIKRKKNGKLVLV